MLYLPKENAMDIARIPIHQIDHAPMWDLRMSKRIWSEFVQSVRCMGVIVPPIVKPNPNDPSRYVVVDGGARLEAAKEVGIEALDCLVFHGTWEEEALLKWDCEHAKRPSVPVYVRALLARILLLLATLRQQGVDPHAWSSIATATSFEEILEALERIAWEKTDTLADIKQFPGFCGDQVNKIKGLAMLPCDDIRQMRQQPSISNPGWIKLSQVKDDRIRKALLWLLQRFPELASSTRSIVAGLHKERSLIAQLCIFHGDVPFNGEALQRTADRYQINEYADPEAFYVVYRRSSTGDQDDDSADSDHSQTKQRFESYAAFDGGQPLPASMFSIDNEHDDDASGFAESPWREHDDPPLHDGMIVINDEQDDGASGVAESPWRAEHIDDVWASDDRSAVLHHAFRSTANNQGNDTEYQLIDTDTSNNVSALQPDSVAMTNMPRSRRRAPLHAALSDSASSEERQEDLSGEELPESIQTIIDELVRVLKALPSDQRDRVLALLRNI